MTTWRRHLCTAAAYVLLALFFTWPLAMHLTTSFPSHDSFSGGDPNIFIWYMDVAAKALTHRLPVPVGQMVFYPGGIDPLSAYDGPLMLIIGVPLTLLTSNPLLAYNVFLLTALVGSALAMYALLLRVTRSYGASVIGGAMFGFSTFMLVRAGLHANLLMIGTFPLLILALLAAGERPDDRRMLLWIGLTTLLNALSSWYYAIAGLVAAGMLLAFQHAIWRPRLARLAATLAVIGGVTVLAALPMLLSSTHGGQPFDDNFVKKTGATPTDFVVPPIVNAFEPTYVWAHRDDVVLKNEWQPNAIEHSSYLGLPLLALIVLFIRRRKTMTVPYPIFWILGFGLFAILSLGMHLRVFGFELPLPFAVLRRVFPFSLARVANRFFVPTLFCADVMAAAVMAQMITAGTFSKLRGRLLAGTAIVILLVERIILPYPLFTPQVSAFHRTLAADPETFAIADLPITSPGFSEYDYFQTIHGKPTTSGEFFYPAYEDSTWSFMRASPLFQAANCSISRSAEHSAPDISIEKDVWPDFRSRNIRYVVVHNLLLQNDPTCAGVQSSLRHVFSGVKPDFTDGALTVYRVPPLP